MAISPDIIIKRLKDAADEAEKQIDKQLQEQKGFSLSYRCYVNGHLPVEVVEELTKRYSAVGWDSLKYDANSYRNESSYSVTLTKNKPTSNHSHWQDQN
jgi:hypothetical protein